MFLNVILTDLPISQDISVKTYMFLNVFFFNFLVVPVLAPTFLRMVLRPKTKLATPECRTSSASVQHENTYRNIGPMCALITAVIRIRTYGPWYGFRIFFYPILQSASFFLVWYKLNECGSEMDKYGSECDKFGSELDECGSEYDKCGSVNNKAKIF